MPINPTVEQISLRRVLLPAVIKILLVGQGFQRHHHPLQKSLCVFPSRCPLILPIMFSCSAQSVADVQMCLFLDPKWVPRSQTLLENPRRIVMVWQFYFAELQLEAFPTQRKQLAPFLVVTKPACDC